MWPYTYFPHDYFAQCTLPKESYTNDIIRWPVSVSVYPTKEAVKQSLPGNNIYIIKENDQGLQKIVERGSSKVKKTMANCIRAVRNNYDDVVMLIEHMEFAASLGISYVPLYGLSFSKRVSYKTQ